MLKTKCGLFSILLISNTINTSVAQSIEDLSNSICKIDYQSWFDSTAFCIDEDDKNYYILSAGHTIDESHKLAKRYNIEDTTSFNLTFNHNGTEKKISNAAKLIRYEYVISTTNDFSLLKFSKKILDDYKPLSVLKISDNIDDVSPGNVIWGYGYPDGGWPTALKGTILEQNAIRSAESIRFFPPARPGRSGSPILNYDLRRVVGMTILSSRRLNEDGSLGESIYATATPFWKINDFLNAKEKNDE